MGALYGYLNFREKPASGISEKMRQPALYWGRDGNFLYDSGPVVIGNLLRYNTAEAEHEQQPYQASPGKYLFFNGRIDNRENLCNLLKIKNETVFPDGLLVSSVYQKYGDEITDYLQGDWVVVLWEDEKRKLTIYRDHHGYSSLYYFCNGRFFAFATSIKSLLALEDIPKEPDMQRVAQVLTSWQGDGLHSAYRDILRLPPAHILEVDEGMQVKTRKHWEPENIRPVHYKNEDDYYSHFFEEYSRAVSQRLRSYKPVGSQLSGGLDSGTVVALAARHLKEQGRRLPAFTSVPAFGIKGMTSASRFGDEGQLAKMTADFTGNTDWYPVDAAAINPFEAVREGIEIHDEPFHAGANTFWISEIKKKAAAMGLGSMLTGQGGNATVSWPTPGFLQLMSRKSELIKAKHFLSWYGWRHVILPLYLPQSAKNFISQKKKGKLPFLQYSAMNRDYAVKNHILEMMRADDHDPSFSKSSSPLKTRLKIIKPGSSIVGFLHAQSAAWSDLEMRDPTFDKQLVEYCLAVPDYIYVSGGKDRMLLRKAFDGLLPPEVLWNTQRGRQAADIGYRVVKFSETGFAMLKEMEANPLCCEILDIGRMRNILNDLCVQVNAKNNSEAGTVLLRGITAGLFLLRFR